MLTLSHTERRKSNPYQIIFIGEYKLSIEGTFLIIAGAGCIFIINLSAAKEKVTAIFLYTSS